MLKTFGPGRTLLDDVRVTTGAGVFFDPARSRPRYFDGRFLAARDLTREQNYFLSRQAALARAIGWGVVEGLQVGHGTTPTSITITSGHGLTESGEIVVLESDKNLELADITPAERLNAAFGLKRLPQPPLRNRSGLFVVAIRAVEFTANPISAYPTSLEERRGLQDGDIIEASAVTLVPFPEEGVEEDSDVRRARAAKRIFVDGVAPGIPSGALPLAMVALSRGVVLWVDSFLVRRDLGVADADFSILDGRPPGVTEAHFLQYEDHLLDVLRDRRRSNRGTSFPASEHFLTLPPAGRFPASSINPGDFTQIFFPAQMEIELSLAPEDEIPRLVNDALVLPPVDLTANAESFETLNVLALVPVERRRFFSLASKVENKTIVLRPPVPGFLATRRPLVMLKSLKLPRLPVSVPGTADTVAAAWREALEGAELLWYVRRRNLTRKTEVTGEMVALDSGVPVVDENLTTVLTSFGLNASFNRSLERAEPTARADVVSLVAASRGSRLRLEGLLNELETSETLDRRAMVLTGRRYRSTDVESGLAIVERTRPDLVENTTVVRNLARSGSMADLGLVILPLSDAERKVVLDEVVRLGSQSGEESRLKLAAYIKERLPRIER